LAGFRTIKAFTNARLTSAPLRPFEQLRSDPVRGGVPTCPSKRGSNVSFQAPVLIVPTADAKQALGVHLQAAGLPAYREIAVPAKGLEIAHLQFVFRGSTLAVCSRIRHDCVVEIEIGLGNPRLPKSAFTAAQMREAEAASRARIGSAPRSGSGAEYPGPKPGPRPRRYTRPH
jgi:hypothetical protein